MSYTKFIRYGNNFELYEYERRPNIIKRESRIRKNTASPSGVATNRTNTLSEEQLGKRQDNARRVSMVFRRIVASNLSGSELPILLTLTYRENLGDIAIGYKDYKFFIQSLRRKYGKAFRYICVPEFQKRGAVHFHALIWGLPKEVLLRERTDRAIAKIWGKGFIYLKETDGNERLSTYLSKYMSKAFTDHRLKNQKAYVASRNINRPVAGKGFSPIWPILDDYVGDNNPPIKEKVYQTKWLGKCRYRLFKISEEDNNQNNDTHRKT